jgi:ABC-2 type transport system permease protein
VTYAAPAAPAAGSAEPAAGLPRAGWVRLPGRVATLCLLELQKLRHDPYELLTRMIQPALWLVIFGTTFSRLRAVPTGGVPYLDYLTPGILAQSALFIAIFFGVQIIGERDAGVLAKLMVTPTPRAALVTGKAFAAGLRAAIQGVAVLLLGLALGVTFTGNPLRILAAFGVLVLGAVFFACLSLVLAGLVLRRDRLMGVGQAIIMPLFFGSNALYPIELIPGWLRWIAYVNPLSYQVDALRGLLLGTPADLVVDVAVLAVVALAGIAAASALLGRLTR